MKYYFKAFTVFHVAGQEYPKGQRCFLKETGSKHKRNIPVFSYLNKR